MASLSELLLPALATNNMLLVFALLISSSRACEKPPLLQLFDRILTFAPVAAEAWMTNSSALIASAVVPVPLASRNFDAMIRVVQLTPTTPLPLLPRAPIVPDTCVPWPLSSHGSHVLVIALKPCVPAGQVMSWPLMVTLNAAGAVQMFPTRSEWL